jgi:multidrug efflux pump subunit AcrB
MGQLFHGVPHEVFPHGQNQCLMGKVSNFQQTSLKSIPEAWERLQEYIQACPHHGMEEWLVLQNFYKGLTPMSNGHDATATGGAFLSLTANAAKALIKKMVANQSSGEEIKQQKGMHFVKEADMLATKIDLLMKRLDDRAAKKEAMKSTV